MGGGRLLTSLETSIGPGMLETCFQLYIFRSIE